jgi:hypothetical protein
VERRAYQRRPPKRGFVGRNNENMVLMWMLRKRQSGSRSGVVLKFRRFSCRYP